MRYSLFFLLWFLSYSFLSSKDLAIPDAKSGQFIYDKAHFWSEKQLRSLEQAVQSIYSHTQNQIAILTIEDLDGLDIADYALQVGRKWGIGHKDQDNGILCLLVKNTRKVWIATGYKIEALVPDVVAKRIIDQTIIPDFAKGNFYSGMKKAIYYLVQNLATAEDLRPQTKKFYQDFLKTPDKFFNEQIAQRKTIKPGASFEEKILGIILGIVFFILLLILLNRHNRNNNGSNNGGGGMSILNTLMLTGLLSGLASGGRSGNRRSSNSGGSFGGGNFGGGGAGGGW